MVLLLSGLYGCAESKSVCDQHFQVPLPRGTRLLNHYSNRSGWSDMTYLFEFEVKDDVMRDRLRTRWHLNRKHEDISWKKAPGWWPVQEGTKRLECYGRDDVQQERYYFVWSDPANERLYVQYGNW